MRQFARAAAALVATFGAACANTPNNAGARDAALESPGDVPAGEGPGGDAPPGVQAVDDLVGALAIAMCHWDFRCCSLPEIDLLGGSSFLTLSECRTMMALGLVNWFVEERAAAAEGRVTVDSQIASACLHEFDVGACSSPTVSLDGWAKFISCPDPVVGHVPVGAPCRLRDECIAGSRCVAGATNMDSVNAPTPEGLTLVPTVQDEMGVLGSCLPYVAEGGTCRFTADCAPALYCRTDTFVCARPAALGERCRATANANSPPNETPLPCDDARDPVVCGGGICGRLPRANEPCLDDGVHPPCDPNPALKLACVGMGLNGAGICEPLGKIGDACGPDGLPPCDFGLACAPPDGGDVGSCALAPTIGEDCSTLGVCREGVCDDLTQVCVHSKGGHDGTRCSNASDCASSNCALTDADGGVCIPPVNDVGCTGQSPAIAEVGEGADADADAHAHESGDGGADARVDGSAPTKG